MNTREQAIAYISGAIATYSLRKERGELEDQASMYDFLAKTIPNDLECGCNGMGCYRQRSWKYCICNNS